MNKGVEILLERMKSNPEEFVAEAQYGVSKWGQAVQPYQEYLNKEDREILDKAWKETVTKEMEERFTQAVMKELLDPKEESNPYLVKPSVTLSGGTTPAVWANTTSTGQVTLPSGSITLGKTTLQEQQLQQLLQLQVEKAKQELEEHKRQETLVGKLYNYLGVNK